MGFLKFGLKINAFLKKIYRQKNQEIPYGMEKQPPTQRWWARAGATMRGAMELGGKNHENRGFSPLTQLKSSCGTDTFLRLMPPKKLVINRMSSRRAGSLWGSGEEPR